MPPFSSRDLRFYVNLGKLVVAGHLFLQYVGTLHRTSGPSMLPTINVDGDWIWVSHLHRRGLNIKVGDIACFKHPLVPGEGACKRVVGMPGDFVMRDTPGSASEMMIQVSLIYFDTLETSLDNVLYESLLLLMLYRYLKVIAGSLETIYRGLEILVYMDHFL